MLIMGKSGGSTELLSKLPRFNLTAEKRFHAYNFKTTSLKNLWPS